MVDQGAAGAYAMAVQHPTVSIEVDDRRRPGHDFLYSME